MKTLLITTLTTALLSFNSFADNTSDIRYMASEIAKEGIQQLNTQLAISSTAKNQQYLNLFTLTPNNKTLFLIAKVENDKSFHVKNTVQSADE